MENYHTRISRSERPHSTDARQNRRIVQAEVIIRKASREDILAHVAPAVSPRTIENRLLATGLRSRVLLTRLPFTSRLRYSGVVKQSTGEWNGSVVFSDDSNFCLYASVGRTHVRRRPTERHLLECIRPQGEVPEHLEI